MLQRFGDEVYPSLALEAVRRELSEEKFADFLVLNHADHAVLLLARHAGEHRLDHRLNGRESSIARLGIAPALEIV